MTRPEHIAELLKASTEAGCAIWFKGDDENEVSCVVGLEIINFMLRRADDTSSEVVAVSAFIRGVEVLIITYTDAGRDLLKLIQGAIEDEPTLARFRSDALNSWITQRENELREK